MKNTKWFLILGLVLIASIAFMGCQETVAPAPVDPPIEEVFEWLEVVPGNFWQVDYIEQYGSTAKSASPIKQRVEDRYMYWSADDANGGDITFWHDANQDNIIVDPSERYDGTSHWALDGSNLTLQGTEFLIEEVTATSWMISLDIIEGTTMSDWLKNEGLPYVGWMKIHYKPAMVGFETPDQTITASFAFAFDDLNDADWKDCFSKYYGKGRPSNVEKDVSDGFVFDFGTVRVIIGNMNVYSDHWLGFVGTDEPEVWFVCPGFEANDVYDMDITVHTDDSAHIQWTSRVDGETFGVDLTLDYSELGAIVIVAINDVDVPVVNP